MNLDSWLCTVYCVLYAFIVGALCTMTSNASLLNFAGSVRTAVTTAWRQLESVWRQKVLIAALRWGFVAMSVVSCLRTYMWHHQLISGISPKTHLLLPLVRVPCSTTIKSCCTSFLSALWSKVIVPLISLFAEVMVQNHLLQTKSMQCVTAGSPLRNFSLNSFWLTTYNYRRWSFFPEIWHNIRYSKFLQTRFFTW